MIDQAVIATMERGAGTELAKIDVEQAYRNILMTGDCWGWNGRGWTQHSHLG